MLQPSQSRAPGTARCSGTSTPTVPAEPPAPARLWLAPLRGHPPPPPALAPHLTQPGSPFASGLRPSCPICGGGIPSAGATSTAAAERLQQPRTKPVKPTLHPNPNTSGEATLLSLAVPQGSQRSPPSLQPSPRSKHPLHARHQRHSRPRKGCSCVRGDPQQAQPLPSTTARCILASRTLPSSRSLPRVNQF